ncbi:MAG: amino acid ABC transporter substrate-binding protein [Kiloniellales bacterium]|nr:amino acid ABC transporter substrate-binding protein [Kiloniellales bacterium]
MPALRAADLGRGKRCRFASFLGCPVAIAIVGLKNSFQSVDFDREDVMRILLGVCFTLYLLIAGTAQADVLARLSQGEPLRLGFREDAAPFSYLNDLGTPVGFSIELCGVVVADLKRELDLPDMLVEFVAVGAEDRFAALQDGAIDLMCGATTATLSRRQKVDFSIPTFIDGASVLYRKDGPADFESLSGQRVGVRGGTTTEEALRKALSDLSVDAEVVSVDDHNAGLEMLETGELAAYFADQGILLFLLLHSEAKDQLWLSGRFFTREPYALALPRGDSDFRLFVDSSLSRLYRDGRIGALFTKSFGIAKPSQLVEALYLINALPE